MFRLGIREANWLLVEIAYIIKLIIYNIDIQKFSIFQFINSKKRNIIFFVLFNYLDEKYYKLNETEGENLFKFLDNEIGKFLVSGSIFYGKVI